MDEVNTPRKLVARFKKKEDQQSWNRGKQGTQAKKAIYITNDDYKKYSPETIKRWLELYDVTAFIMVNRKWEQFDYAK